MVSGEEDYNSDVWVKYWNPVVNRPNMWTPPTTICTKYTVNLNELVATLGFPTPVQEGRAIYYTFQQMEE